MTMRDMATCVIPNETEMGATALLGIGVVS